MKNKLIYIIISFLIHVDPVFSAEIREIKTGNLSYILIKGSIEKGDFSKFFSVALKVGYSPISVFISSPGGDLGEAMKIGRFIRDLNWATEVPKYFPNKNPFCPFQDHIKASECTCLSACALIFFSGFKRYGDYLGVHRAYLLPREMSKLNFQEASKAQKEISKSVELYLRELAISEKLIELILHTPSDEVLFLHKVEKFKNLQGIRDPGHQEFIRARCGSFTKSMKASRKNADNPYFSIIMEEIIECESDLHRNLMASSYFSSILKHSTFIKNSAIKKDIEYLKTKNLYDFIGMKLTRFVDLMKYYGIVYEINIEKLNLYKGISFYMTDGLAVWVDDQLRVSGFDLHYFKLENRNTFYDFFKGSIINAGGSYLGFSRFFKIVGSKRCVKKTGVCLQHFKYKKISIKAGFEANGTVRFVNLKI